MAEETEEVAEETQNRGNRRRSKWIAAIAVALVAAFLIGFVPSWLRSREAARELVAANASLRTAQLHVLLGDAAMDARRGEYESARQGISKFFGDLREELDRGNESAFSPAQKERLESMLVGRDDMVTLLARSDPATGGRLADMHAAFRQALSAPAK